MRTMAMLAAVGVIGTAGLGGCTLGQWRKPGFTQADFQRDLAQCDVLVAPVDNIPLPVRPLSGLGQGLSDGEKYCLRDRGWTP